MIRLNPDERSTYSSPMLLSTIGLSLDIIGVILLFFFGLPPKKAVSRGAVRLAVGYDEDEAIRAKWYDRCSRLALTMIILGFGLQIADIWIK